MPRRDRSLAALATALAAAALGASLCVADVDLELRNADSVKGTLDPGTETETFRFSVPAKAKLTLSAKGTKKGFATVLVLRSPAAAEVARANKSGKIAGYKVAASGEYTAVVTSKNPAKTGDYAFTASWVSSKSFKPGKLTFSGDTDPTYRFSADAGAKVKVTVTSASDAVPQIVSITGPAGDVEGADDGKGGKTEKTSSLTLPATGDYDVTVRDVRVGPAGGTATIKVQVTPPKPSKRKIDISGKKLGGDAGAFARIVSDDGGTIAVPAGIAGLEALEGASISVEPGVLPAGAVIVIGTALPLPLADGTVVLGPAVFFGPEGLKFGTDAAPGARISIPVDVSLVGGDASQVHVFTRTSKGQILEIDPGLLDFATAPGFVQFPVSHFSSFVAAAAQGTPTVAVTTIVNAAAQLLDAAIDISDDTSSRVYFVTDGTPVLREVNFTGTGYTAPVYAGGGATPVAVGGTPRLQADFGGPVVAVTSTSDATYCATATRVFKIDVASGNVVPWAGTGVSGDDGDEGPALAAQFQNIADLHVDFGDDLWIVDSVSARVRRIDASLNIRTVAGDGITGSNGDANPAAQTHLQNPTGVISRFGFTDMFICEQGRVRIVHVAADTLETLVGDPDGAVGCATGGEIGTAARLDGLNSIAAEFDGSRVIVGSDACDALYAIDVATKVVSVRYGTPGTPGFRPDGGIVLPAPATNPKIIGTTGVFDVYLDFGGSATGALRAIAGLQ